MLPPNSTTFTSHPNSTTTFISPPTTTISVGQPPQTLLVPKPEPIDDFFSTQDIQQQPFYSPCYGQDDISYLQNEFYRVSELFNSTFGNRESPTQEQQQPVVHAPQPLEFSQWDPRYIATYSYTWDQNESNHRALKSIHESLYKLQLQMGVPPNIDHQVMTPDAYQTHVAWPGVRPYYQDGARAASTNGSGGDNDEVKGSSC
ncbi:histone-lysine N-methyltransferase family member SUVH9 [Trifolium repens]|jgi:hypothetical protein|nr:histone-lysine N-methyltransferase family member SUVH9 [Trifolium repens]